MDVGVLKWVFGVNDSEPSGVQSPQAAGTGAKRVRRTARQGEVFRNELISSARALFIERGYEAVSIRKITERAGCPMMTFYVYFRSKRELIRHIWDDILKLAFDAANESALQAHRPEARLKAFFLSFISYFVSNPDNYRIVFFHEDRLSSVDDAYYADSSQIMDRFEIVYQAIREGIAGGEFAPTDIAAACQVLQMLAVGIAHSLITLPELRWSEGIAEIAINQAIAGLRVGAVTSGL
jgi:AcrR family transcriptional regulator